MSGTVLSKYSDRAMEVAMEHVAWCLQNGQGLRRIAKSVGANPDSIESIDDALMAVANAWLLMDRTPEVMAA